MRDQIEMITGSVDPLSLNKQRSFGEAQSQIEHVYKNLLGEERKLSGLSSELMGLLSESSSLGLEKEPDYIMGFRAEVREELIQNQEELQEYSKRVHSDLSVCRKYLDEVIRMKQFVDLSGQEISGQILERLVELRTFTDHLSQNASNTHHRIMRVEQGLSDVTAQLAELREFERKMSDDEKTNVEVQVEGEEQEDLKTEEEQDSEALIEMPEFVDLVEE